MFSWQVFRVYGHCHVININIRQQHHKIISINIRVYGHCHVINSIGIGGVVVGMHGGDENAAIAAMERGEVEARENPSKKGPRMLYSIYSLEGDGLG